MTFDTYLIPLLAQFLRSPILPACFWPHRTAKDPCAQLNWTTNTSALTAWLTVSQPRTFQERLLNLFANEDCDLGVPRSLRVIGASGAAWPWEKQWTGGQPWAAVCFGETDQDEQLQMHLTIGLLCSSTHQFLGLRLRICWETEHFGSLSVFSLGRQQSPASLGIR